MGWFTKYQGIIDSKTNFLCLLRPTISKNNFLYLEDSLTLPPYTECLTSVLLYQGTTEKNFEIFIKQ